MKHNMTLDKDTRDNCLRQIKDNKQFNIYPKIKDDLEFAEKMVQEVSN